MNSQFSPVKQNNKSEVMDNGALINETESGKVNAVFEVLSYLFPATSFPEEITCTGRRTPGTPHHHKRHPGPVSNRLYAFDNGRAFTII